MEGAKDKTKTKIKFKYEISSNYAVYSIAGAHGGINAQGDIVVNLFSERASIPISETIEITEGYPPKEKLIETQKDASVVRNVFFGLALDPKVAESIGKWLIARAAEHKKLVNEQKKNVNMFEKKKDK